MDNVNEISDGLRKLVNAAKPKSGQTVRFISVRPNARGTTVPSRDRIFDPFKENESGDTGAWVDIGYITGRNPAKGKLEAEDQYGRIQFTKGEGGLKVLRMGDKSNELLFEYLYLCNYLKNNHPTKDNPDGAKWFVAGHNPVCLMEEPEKSAAEKLEIGRVIRRAGDAIDNMPDSTLRDFANGLELKGITSQSSSDEIRVKLTQMASTHAGAVRVLSLDKDESLKIKINIKAFEKAGIVEKDENIGQWRWCDGQQPICVIPPGSKPYEALTSYYLSQKGSEAYKMAMRILETEKPDAKKKSK